MNESGFYFDRVMIIDDSEIDVLVNRRLIELTHFASNITVAVNGEEALYYLKEEYNKPEYAPDWIFLDMHLPMMSGYDFIEEFKLLPDYIKDKTKIIILSVYQKQEKLKEILENKFIAGHMEKPLTQQALRHLAQYGEIKVTASS